MPFFCEEIELLNRPLEQFSTPARYPTGNSSNFGFCGDHTGPEFIGDASDRAGNLKCSDDEVAVGLFSLQLAAKFNCELVIFHLETCVVNSALIVVQF